LTADIARCWPPFDLVADYYRLLGDQALLSELAEGVFAPDDVAKLRQAEPEESNVIDLSDLAGLLYLYVVANGTQVPLYDHVIIDEAQDVSRLQFEVVRRFSRNGSFTILGDLSQSIHAYRGVASWEEVKEAFGTALTTYSEIRRGYRTTYEIATFANDVQRATAREGRLMFLTEPFERHGEAPGLHPLADGKEMPGRVAEVVRQLRAAGYQHIAIIAKTAEDCSRLAGGLQEAGLADLAVALVSDYKYTGGLVLLPVHLAKGMEFEAALVVDADDMNYSATAFDGRLLHTALTRAQHVLHVFWAQTVSFHLEHVIKPFLAAPQPSVAQAA
jgi:DNA helicase-2/ATP-dependent DNA helicase PcrA